MRELSLTELISRWLVWWRERGIPENALKTAQAYVLDWLGSALAGSATDPGAKLIDYAQAQPSGPASLVGLKMGRSPEVAAFVNGARSHILEMDDLDRGSVVHPGTVVIPAALATAEREQTNGRNFLSAVVAGYEVAIRVGEAVGKRHYYHFHNTGTCGVFGAAAATGWLLGLSEPQLVWALGNAGTQAAGLWEFNTDGDMSKHLHAGRAAAVGLLAGDLASRGFTGARKILEGERGLFAATAPDADPAALSRGWSIDDPASLFRISGVSIKPYSSCRHTHATIDAVLSLREQLAGSEIERVRVDVYQAALDLCDNPNPETTYGAKFSLQYCVALALHRGRVNMTDFTPEAIADPELRPLLPRVALGVDPVFESRYPAEWPARVRLSLADGRKLSACVIQPKGDPENPLTQSELRGKFRNLATYGGHSAVTEGLIQWVEGLGEDCPVQYESVPIDSNKKAGRVEAR
jgi:2-methylcitrate dehydratase PrpD